MKKIFFSIIIITFLIFSHAPAMAENWIIGGLVKIRGNETRVEIYAAEYRMVSEDAFKLTLLDTRMPVRFVPPEGLYWITVGIQPRGFFLSAAWGELVMVSPTFRLEPTLFLAIPFRIEHIQIGRETILLFTRLR